MKKLLAIVCLLLCLGAYSQTKVEIVVMTIQQKHTVGSVDPYIRISYPNLTTKIIELEKGGIKSDNQNEDMNAKTIQKAINELTREGYRLISSDTNGDITFSRTMMIFERKIE